MQTRFRLSILFFIAAFVVFSSCSKKTNKEGRYIPKTAGVVFLLNGKSMTEKLPWEEIKKSEMFQNAATDSTLKDYMKSTLENPESTGVDTKNNLLIFFQKDVSGSYIAVQGFLKDVAKFKAFNMLATKGAVESDKDGIHFFSNDKMTSSYDKEKFILVVDVPEVNRMNGFNKSNPDTKSKRDLIKTATDIYALSEDNSLAKDQKFTDLVSTKGDILFWMSSGSLMAGNPEMAAMTMLNISKLYDDTYVTGVGNFENGKITVDIRSYAGKELTDLYKKYSGATINTDMVKRIPAKDLAGLFAFSYKPDGLKELIKLTGMEGFINMGAAELGFTFEDFIKANKGDILVSVSDIKKDSFGSPNANVLFATAIGDKNAFKKLIEAGNKLSKERMGSSAEKLFHSSNDNFFSIGTDKPSVDKFIASSNNSNFNIMDKISGKTSAFYINFPVIFSAWGTDIRDSLDKVAFDASVKMWDNVIATGEGFKNGCTNEHIEINLIDKNTNSLKQLNKYVGEMSAIEKLKKEKRDKWMNEGLGYPEATPDSTVTMAPVQ